MKFIRRIYFNPLVNRLNKNLKIGQKSYLAFLLVSIMILLFTVFVWFSYQDIKKREQVVQDFYSLSNQNYKLLILLEKQLISLGYDDQIHIQNEEVKKATKQLNNTIRHIESNSRYTGGIDFRKFENILHEVGEIPIYNLSSSEVLSKAQKVSNISVINEILDDLEIQNRKIENAITSLNESTDRALKTKNMLLFIFLGSGLLGSVIIANFISYRITDPIEKLKDNIKVLENGNYNIDNRFEVLDNDEIGDIAKGIDRIGKTIKETVSFTEKIGNNQFDSDLILNKEGKLGKALLSMRDNLKAVTEQNEIQKKQEEKRNWVIKGLAELGNTLRENYESNNDFYFEILRTITNYINANQGGLFVIDESDGERVLKLSASYAYNRRKYLKKKIEIGEGLVGQCAFEKELTNLTEIPDHYVQITSGLGGSNPKNLILVPLVLNDEIYGVIELASFEIFDEYVIDYLKQSAESIASELSSIQINNKTKELLEKTQVQAEEIASREEEMRQNMEELQATQEESQRKAEQQETIIAELKESLRINGM